MQNRETSNRFTLTVAFSIIMTGLTIISMQATLAADQVVEVTEPKSEQPPSNMSVQLSGTINAAGATPEKPKDANSYGIPILVANQRQGMAYLSAREEQNINALLRTSKSIGLIRLASVIAAKGEGFKDYTWRNVFLVYGPTRRDECRVKIQKSRFLKDIKRCDAISSVRSVQYAYVKYNNWDVAIERIMTAIARGIQIASFAVPLGLNKNF